MLWRRGGSRFVQLLTLIGALGASPAALAADEQDEDGQGEQGEQGEEPDALHADFSSETEFSVVPFVGGSSDVGFGGGYIASLARLRPNRKPYVYRIDTTGSITFSGGGESPLKVPYADMFFRWKYPHLIPNRLGLELRVSYTRETNLKYYGVGNASSIPPGMDRGDEFFQHERNHPMLRATWDYRQRPFSFSWGVSYSQNWFAVPAGTQLANDMQSDLDYVRELLGTAHAHGVPKFSFGAAWDTRDDDVAPVRGLSIQEEVDLTPGTWGGAHYRFARWTNTVQAYVPLIARERRLVLALRVASDLLFGNAPFYELPRFDDSFAIGGSKGVRGVPAQRYYGKIKILGNAELRSELLSLRILGTQRRLGLVGFVDTGRLWADHTPHPDLDGSELGLAYGVGGGLRVASGKTFMLRFDLAWSPDKQGYSGYLLAGHMF